MGFAPCNPRPDPSTVLRADLKVGRYEYLEGNDGKGSVEAFGNA